MALKLNKSIKTHIADMAIRKKYKGEFLAKMKAVSDKAYSELYAKYNNDDFSDLPERALSCVKRAKDVDCTNLQMEIVSYAGTQRGYGLNVAFDTRRRIDCITMPHTIIGSDHKFYNAANLFDAEFKELTKFLNVASGARETLLNAMSHYKSADKMFKELPWTEEFYPESEKKPVCNIVPISTIVAANDLMGVTVK